MKMKFFPDEYINSTYEIDFEALYAAGYRGVIFDVDNTLVPHGAPADDRAVQFFERLHRTGYSVMLLSNNKEPRVKSFKEQVKYCDYIYRANKPSATGYEKAMEKMGTAADNTLFVGDQIFTDIWGARNADIHAIMVKPVEKWKEEPQIVIKRFLEAPVLWVYMLLKKFGGR